MASVAAPETYRVALQQQSLENDQDVDSSTPEELHPAPLSWFEEENSKEGNLYAMNSKHLLRHSESEDDSLVEESDENCSSIAGSEEEEESAASLRTPPPPPPRTPTTSVGEPLPAPSWTEISTQVLPTAARELLSSTMQRVYHTAHLGYAKGRWQRNYSELGNNAVGYFRPDASSYQEDLQLPPFSSLPWVERQLVQEWRTYRPNENEEGEEEDFQRARTLVPKPAPRPLWHKAEACFACHKTFGPSRLRHHCRLCGHSFCQTHCSARHALPHLGYHPDVPERVCLACKRLLLDRNLAERVAWRLARCRDHQGGNLTPYFETGVDSLEKVALRITQAALTMARSIPLGAQATVAVETADVLRKYGLNGIYTIMLRQEFLAAADLLRKALGINRTAWPLSVHELSAAIFYALAQHRAMRGLNPDREEAIHTFRDSSRVDLVENAEDKMLYGTETARIDNLVSERSEKSSESTPNDQSTISAVCDPVPDNELESLIFYAPIALNFIYAEKEVDMQLLAAQQGWRLLYAQLELPGVYLGHDIPASALFLHDELKIACLAIRGTTTIHDVITDIRQVPLPFPETDPHHQSLRNEEDDDWTEIMCGQGVAVCGMANAAMNLYDEHIESILFYARKGYRIRLAGHSLGGGVASLLGVLVRRDLLRDASKNPDVSENKPPLLKVYAYGTPPCVDGKLSEYVESFTTTAVLHDDAVPRLTPTSCRELLKYLLHIRETWVKEHLPDDIMAITDRAKSAWAPRWRGSFTLPASLPTSSSTIRRYCRKHIQNGKKKLQSVREKLVGDDRSEGATQGEDDHSCDISFEPIPEDDIPTTLVVEYMGGADSGSVGVVIEGDEFFDAGGSLIEGSDDERDDGSFGDACEAEQASVRVGTDSKLPIGVANSEDALVAEDDDDGPGAVVLEETPLPRMFIPGRVVHIYSHRGVYKVAYVPRAFRELRRISLAGNMLTDHTCKSYYEALLEVRTVRKATEAPPRWTAFDEDITCSCCASRFTWASTSDNAAQEARDKHNCRSCGTLVCDPCSKNRIPLPSIGLTVAVRVCDRCYNDMDGVVGSKPSAMRTSSSGGLPAMPDTAELPERQRPRRSAVVDDLAARVLTTPHKCAMSTQGSAASSLS